MGQYRLHFAVVSTMYSTGRPGTRSAPRRKLHRIFARLVQRMREMLDSIFSWRRWAAATEFPPAGTEVPVAG
jgi:hypothetical protein